MHTPATPRISHEYNGPFAVLFLKLLAVLAFAVLRGT